MSKKSSDLNAQLNSFNRGLAAQADKVVKRAVVATPPSSTSSSGVKRKVPPTSQPATKNKNPSVVYSQPADTQVAQNGNWMTQVHYVVQYLKEKERPLSTKEISSYLGRPLGDTLKFLLKKNERLVYDAATDTFLFKPVHNIRTKEALLEHLRGQKTAHGLLVKELKEGWSGAEEAIKELEATREILVTRTKKDNQPRMVWINDKSLDLTVDEGMNLLTLHYYISYEPRLESRCFLMYPFHPSA